MLHRDGLLLQGVLRQIGDVGSIYIGYVENLDINAVAFEREGQDFVGLYAGAVVHIYRHFGALLCNCTFVPSIGSPDAEAHDPRSLNYADGEQSMVPNDPQRRSYARLLSRLACDFLLNHEFGHLINGHLKLMKALSGTACFAELDAVGTGTFGSLSRQALEMDADCFAVQQGVLALLECVNNPSALPESSRCWYSSVDEALRTWTLAIYGLLRLFDGSPTDLDHLEAGPHPPPPIRAMMASATAMEVLKSRGHSDHERRCSAAFSYAMVEVERATAEQRGAPSIDPRFILPATDVLAIAHVGRLEQHWTNVVRPQLVPHARGGRLAP